MGGDIIGGGVFLDKVDCTLLKVLEDAQWKDPCTVLNSDQTVRDILTKLAACSKTVVITTKKSKMYEVIPSHDNVCYVEFHLSANTKLVDRADIVQIFETLKKFAMVLQGVILMSDFQYLAKTISFEVIPAPQLLI